MFQKRTGTVLAVLIAALTIVGTALAASIDTTTRTVNTPTLNLDFSDTNPEELSYISWNGSPNLTNTGVIVRPFCTDTLEYFGNAWAGPDGSNFVSLVGWGQTGNWDSKGSSKVTIDSVSESASGCFGALDIPIDTDYQFWDHGPVVNRLKVQRKFHFGGTPFTQNFRPYIPRMYPRDQYIEVYHPDASGTSLLTQNPASCEFGCQVSDWDNSWYAIHNPSTGQGLIVRHAASSYDADLWVEQDGESFTNATSTLLIQPAGGFTGTVSETQFMCFYDSTTWTPSLTLPPGC